jgi:hypothetical protein
MAKEWPEFVEKLQKEGVLYTRVLPEGDDLSSAIGRGWQSTFLTTDHLEAEKRQVCTSSVCLSGLCLLHHYLSLGIHPCEKGICIAQ